MRGEENYTRWKEIEMFRRREKILMLRRADIENSMGKSFIRGAFGRLNYFRISFLATLTTHSASNAL